MVAYPFEVATDPDIAVGYVAEFSGGRLDGYRPGRDSFDIDP